MTPRHSNCVPNFCLTQVRANKVTTGQPVCVPQLYSTQVPSLNKNSNINVTQPSPRNKPSFSRDYSRRETFTINNINNNFIVNIVNNIPTSCLLKK